MEAIIKTVQSQLQQKREKLASLKEQITSLKEQAIFIEKEEKELCNLLQSLTQNLETTSEPIETSNQTSKQPEPVTSTSKTQQSSSPSSGEKGFMKREEDIEKYFRIQVTENKNGTSSLTDHSEASTMTGQSPVLT
ncbi:hypothetical protein Tco_1249173 [Tanacetum coccineum]